MNKNQTDKYPAISQKILIRKENLQLVLTTLEELKDVAQIIESEFTPDQYEYNNSQEKIKEIDNIARDLVNLKRKIDMQNEALSKFKTVSQIDSDPERQFRTFVQNASKRFGPLENEKIMTDKTYQSIYETIRRVHHPNEKMPWMEDDDLIVTNTGEVSLECSITMTTFVDPVKGPCGHTYSKEGILGLLRNSSRRIKCPVAGCNSQLSEKDLEPDYQMRVLLERHQKRNQTGSNNSKINNVLDLED